MTFIKDLFDSADQGFCILKFMEKVESLGRHVIDGVGHFLHYSIAKVRIFDVSINKILRFLYSFFPGFL